MIYIKKIINQDLERTPTFNVESIHDFFKIKLSNGQFMLKKIILIPGNEEFDVKFQKRETRDEYRVFLNELFQKINPVEGDILILKKRNLDVFLCEHININHRSYDHLNHLFQEKNNHQLIINDFDNERIQNPSQSLNLLDEFVSWFIDLDGIKHNYFTDSFSNNKQRLISELLFYEQVYENEFKTKVFTTLSTEINNLIDAIKTNIEKKEGEFFEYSSKKSNHMPRAILGKNNYLKFLKDLTNKPLVNMVGFSIMPFHKATMGVGLIFTPQLIQRFVASLLTKPFVICSGLSGSGKTKLAQAFVQWICESDKQYKIIPVGADWTNREPLLGYPNGLDFESYVTPDTCALQIISEASKLENQSKPYFIILDEMNLSHVERYFADFLSIMESGDSIKLYSGADRFDSEKNKIEKEFIWPQNLFIIGTVNIDETTNMFSPKVLDRANTIEFRVTQNEMLGFLGKISPINMAVLVGNGSNMAKSFVDMAAQKYFVINDEINETLLQFFGELKKVGAEFGYRSATEMLRLIHQITNLDNSLTQEQKIDIAIMQKLLPKLHGSRRKLCPILEKLGSFCIKNDIKIIKDVFENTDFDFSDSKVIYPLSLEKIARMYRGAVDNGFTSFAEA